MNIGRYCKGFFGKLLRTEGWRNARGSKKLSIEIEIGQKGLKSPDEAERAFEIGRVMSKVIRMAKSPDHRHLVERFRDDSAWQFTNHKDPELRDRWFKVAFRLTQAMVATENFAQCKARLLANKEANAA